MQLVNPRSAGARRAAVPAAEPTTMDFVVRWAEDQLASSVAPRAAGEQLTLREVALVTRQIASIFGDRPLAGVTLGDIAQLPALLEDSGLSPEVSRSACRAIGNALRTTIRQWPEGASHHH